jgi:type IV pilus assembly protein PilM
LVWLEIIRSINGLIPREVYPEGKIPTHKEKPLEDRIDFHFTQFETKYFEDLAEEWYTDAVKVRFREELIDWHKVTKRPMEEALPEEIPGPEGPGWVIQLQGFHYYNSPERMGEEGSNHVRKYLTTAFKESPIILPDSRDPTRTITWTPQEMGLSFPLLLDDTPPMPHKIPNPDYDPVAAAEAMANGPTGFQAGADDEDAASAPEPPFFEVPRQDFTFQIIWQPKTPSERIAARKAALEEAALLEGTVPPPDGAAATDPAAAPAPVDPAAPAT